MKTRSRIQQGLSLIELLVAMALGLIITLFLSALFIRSNTTTRNLDQGAQMADSARFALNEIGRITRQTAFIPGKVNASAALGAERTDHSWSDKVTFSYNVENSRVASDNTMRDCSGTIVNAGDGMVINEFMVEESNGVRRLVCKSTIGSKTTVHAVIAENVEAMRVMVGYAMNGGGSGEDGGRGCIPNQFLFAKRSGEAPVALPMVALRVGLLMRSTNPQSGNIQNSTNSFPLLGQELSGVLVLRANDLNYGGGFNGRYLRRIYGASYVLRNSCAR
ncbi:PilW family protein [Craterilacuibacter sp.]|uniref:PilW family protein n=1 Tax=Craterilacuibacter sp. TaxID=2870909 RepID=UPI003F3EE1A4